MLIAAHTAPHPARHALQSRSLPFCRSRRFERPHVQVVCDFVGKTRRAYLQERKAVGACKSRAAAAKAVEDEIAAAGAVPDGVGYERDRLDRGVHGKLIEPICTEHVRPGIGPDIAAVTSMLSELDIVNVLAAAVLPDKDEFVLAAVERPHAGI